MISETEMQDILREVLVERMEEDNDEVITSVLTYEEAGVLTRNKGVVVSVDDDSEFQIQIVRSAP